MEVYKLEEFEEEVTVLSPEEAETQQRGGSRSESCQVFEEMICTGGVLGATGTLGKANSHFNSTQTGSGPHHHAEAAVDWCSFTVVVR